MAGRRGAGLRPRLDLRPPRLGRAAGLPVVRRGAHARRGGRGHVDDRARDVRVLAELPPPLHLRPRRAHPRRPLRWPLPLRARHRRRRRLADPRGGADRPRAGGPLPRVRPAAGPTAARGPRRARRRLVRPAPRADPAGAGAPPRPPARRGRRPPVAAAGRHGRRRLDHHRAAGADDLDGWFDEVAALARAYREACAEAAGSRAAASSCSTPPRGSRSGRPRCTPR